MSGAYNPNSITAANGGVAAKARWKFVKGAVKDGLVTTGKVSVRECVSARRAATASGPPRDDLSKGAECLACFTP